MRLPTLKTSALPMLDSRRVTTLEAKAGATERLSAAAAPDIIILEKCSKKRNHFACLYVL